jgi:hypothetical protein
MAAQLEPARRPASAERGVGRTATADAPPPSPRSPRANGDDELTAAPAPDPLRSALTARPAGGLGMLLIFVGAALVVTFAVAIVGVSNRWWVLAPVMLVDFAATFGVSFMIVRLLADDGEQR